MGSTSVFVYEHITGGGLLAGGDAPLPSSLAREGRAMRDAVAMDFAAIDGVKVSVMYDVRVPPPDLGIVGTRLPWTWHEASSHDMADATYRKLAAESDFTLVIAPEIDGALFERCMAALVVGGRLLGPSPELIALASDKHATAKRLAAAGVRTPRGKAISPGDAWPIDFDFPAVLKPRDGAGSIGVRLIERAADLEAISVDRPQRLEEYMPGWAASVAAICGPAGDRLLPACWQHLSTDGRFSYLAGSVPIPEELAGRAHRLAACALAALPPRQGWIGIDLVVADRLDDSGDAVIEVNPRLTTSYVGLRNANIGNLAQAMLDAAHGLPCNLNDGCAPTEWSADGTIGN